MLLRSRVIALIFTTMFSFNASANGDYQVLASIRPLALIVQDIVKLAELENSVSVDTLLQRGQSAHHYAVKLSDIQRIKSANLLVWVGPQLEHFLEKPITQYRSSNSLAFSTVVEPDSEDSHQWLDYERAIKLADAVAVQLQLAFPRANLANARLQFMQRLQHQHEQLFAQYSALPGWKGVVVYHNGFGYFLKRYGVKQLASLTDVPEQQISMKQLLAVKPLASQRCLLVDKDEQQLAAGYALKLDARLAVADLLAADDTLTSYPDFLKRLSDTVADCLP